MADVFEMDEVKLEINRLAKRRVSAVARLARIDAALVAAQAQLSDPADVAKAAAVRAKEK